MHAGRGGFRRETRGYEKGLDRQNLRRMLPECFGLGELCPKHTSTYSLIILFHHFIDLLDQNKEYNLCSLTQVTILQLYNNSLPVAIYIRKCSVAVVSYWWDITHIDP